MARQIERLSSAQVKHAKPGMHPDGGGLYLQVTTAKDGQINKSWIFRFAVAAKERQMGLGSLKTIGLRDARDEAEGCRKLLRKGKDPIVERDAKEAALDALRTLRLGGVTRWRPTDHILPGEGQQDRCRDRQVERLRLALTLSDVALPCRSRAWSSS